MHSLQSLPPPRLGQITPSQGCWSVGRCSDPLQSPADSGCWDSSQDFNPLPGPLPRELLRVFGGDFSPPLCPHSPSHEAI